jgi:hypothetical protein
MRDILRPGAIALALVGGLGVTVVGGAWNPSLAQQPGAMGSSSMQRPLALTESQKRAIFQSIASERGQNAPANFQASIGAPVPGSLTLKDLPRQAQTQVPAAAQLKYAKLVDESVLLVDPSNRQVVEIIEQR